MSVVLRYLLISCVALGLLAPKMTAALAEVIPGVQTFVICTGSEIVRVTLSADGEPIEEPVITTDHCVLGDLAAHTPDYTAHWHALARDYQFRFSVRLHPAPNGDLFAIKWPSQAPPPVV
ncbi:hypothetical protein [Litoreibacter roseus]|uniref:Uncharacterized protein n=1 Tax=Litoreibacter roseus TaxID=2601869 RepID=A0A6N6JGE0_9RHOB|nr:hypothetical protein [Litoreibacter roseus]GFE64890.1 hypothetical protein KIN_19640 [Litoreibacter roseus]